MANLSPLPVQQFFTNNGKPAVGYLLFTFAAGTSTKQATYTDSSGGQQNTNPIVLDFRGEANVWLDPDLTYKFVLSPAGDTDPPTHPIWTVDNIPGTTELTQDQFNALLIASAPFKRTPQEIAYGITPVNYTILSHQELGHVSPLRYMTVAMMNDIISGTGSLDTAAIYNAVWEFAASAGLPTSIPAGRSRISSGLTVPQGDGFTLFGFGDKSVIAPSGTFSKALTIGNGASQSIRGHYSDFLIDCLTGSPSIEYGIYFERGEELNFDRVKVWGARVMGCSNGFGYVNNYTQCEFSYGIGTSGFGAIGLGTNQVVGAGGNNSINVTNCLLFDNDGFGLWARGGYNINIRGNTIEENKKGGIYLDGCAASGIRENYFEDNGATGYVFTTPSKTIKADIILVGNGVAAEMGNAFPCHGVSVENCHSSTVNTQTCFVWNGGCNDLEINNCTTNQPTVPLLGECYNPAYKGIGTTIRGCTDFDTQVLVTDASSAINNVNAAYFEIFAPTLNFQARNYALTDFNQWGVVVSGSAGTFRRSQSASLYRLYSLDVWEINSSAVGSGDTFGFSLDAALYPELVGKTLWYGLWCYAPDADPYVVPYCSEQTFNNNPTTAATWVLAGVSFTWPASGTINFGAFKSGGTTGSTYVSAPMLCVLGVPSDDAIALIQKSRIWYGTAAPTTGTWERGDTVLNTSPSSGGPPGWACTTAGTPG